MNANDPNEVYLWRIKSGNRTLNTPYWRRCAIGANNGYSLITIASKHYLLHRVCYYAHNPEWDIYDTSHNNEIDHIDRDKTNNHISNLRQATAAQNHENNNAKGYFYHKKNKCWVAQVRKDGKQYTKHSNTETGAIAARAKLKAKYHSF